MKYMYNLVLRSTFFGIITVAQQKCSFHGYFMHLAVFGTNVPQVVQPCNVFGHIRYTLPSVMAAYVTF